MGLLLVLLLAAAPAWAARLARGPYLEGVTRASGFVCWRTDVPSAGALELLDAGGARRLGLLEDPGPKTDRCLEAQGLQASGSYSYRVGYGPPGEALVWTSTRPLRAAEAPDASALRFAVLGDSGKGTPGQYGVARRLVADSPGFVLHVGDVIYPDGADDDYGPRYFEPYGPLLDRAPFYIAIGNHDWANHRFRREAAVDWVARNFLAIHRLPRQLEEGTWRLPEPGRTYYSFDRGPAHFAALDVNQVYPIPGAPPIEPGSAQWRWLDADLAASTAAWKFVFLHVALYSTGGHGANERLIAWLAPLFERRGVDVVFQGHDHHYERTFPIQGGRRAERGPVYIVAGNGGATLHRRKRAADWSVAYFKRFGYVDARLDGRRLTLEAVAPDGEVFDRLILEK